MKRESIVLIGLLAMALQGNVTAQQNLPPEVVHYADLIVTNGVIYSADDHFSRYQAMAVRDGKVLALGTSDQISRMAGPNTRRIELQQGQSVLPGLFDTHAHGPIGTGGGSTRVRGSFTFGTIEEGLREVEQLVREAAEGEWVTASGPFGGNDAMNNVTRWQLDTVSPNNPLLINYGGELSVVNSKAWEAAGLPSDIHGALKNEEGELTGQLRTTAYGAMVYVIPWSPITNDDLASRKRTFFLLNAQGITTVSGRSSGRGITIVRELWERDELPIRVRVAHMFLRSNPRAEEYLKRIGKLVSFGLDDMVRIIGATTQHSDGITGAGAALTWQPKLRQMEGDPYSIYGENRWEVEGNDSESIKLGIRYGWNISGVHNVGDRASWLYLKAIEAGHEGEVLVGTSLPHGNDHNTLHTPENIALMKKYNVVPSMGLYLGEESMIFQYGADTAHRTSAFKTMIAAGLRPSSEEYRPALRAIERLITRAGCDGRAWGAHEALSRQEALWARTLWSAGYIGEEDKLGSLEVGKLGDFVVLGEDYLRVPENEISQIPVLMTFVGGKMVYGSQRDGVPEQSESRWACLPEGGN